MKRLKILVLILIAVLLVVLIATTTAKADDEAVIAETIEETVSELIVIEPEEPKFVEQPTITFYAKSAVNVREAPLEEGNKPIFQIPRGTQVQVVESAGGWSTCKFDMGGVPEYYFVAAKLLASEAEWAEIIEYDYVSSNTDLTEEEKILNAKCIYHYLSKYGWTPNAIFALLGNAEHESSINPGRWQIGGGPGFGLVQWTPGKKKVIAWANGCGKDAGDMMVQLEYLELLAQTGEGWCSHKGHSQSFYEFTRDTEHDVDWLTESFMVNYEMPKSHASIKIRKSNARKWKDFFENNA